MDDLPLLELFTRLRQAGLPLGVDDYQSMLQALQAGYGLPDRAALARLCRILWVKSVEEKYIFDYHFEQLIGSETVPQTQASNVNQNQAIQLVRFATLVGVLVLGVGLAVWVTRPKNQVSVPSSTIPLPTSVPEKLPSPVQQPVAPTPTAQITQKKSQINWPAWLIFLLILAVTSGCLWLLRLLIKRRAQNNHLQTEPSKPIPTATLASESFGNIQDEVQVAQAIRQVTSGREVLGDRFLFSTDYLPVTQRQMKQMWRHLRRLTKEGIATELDIEATVNQIGRYGMMLEPVLSPARVNRTELLLLIDQDGSMVPFHSLSVRLGDRKSVV